MKTIYRLFICLLSVFCFSLALGGCEAFMGEDGAPGEDGKNGPMGMDGATGEPGIPCPTPGCVNINSDDIAQFSIVSNQIADYSVGRIKLAPYAVSEGQLADDAVNSRVMAPNAVLSEHITQNAITSDKIYPGAVQTSHIFYQAVNRDKILDGAVYDEKITGPINGSKLQDASVTNAKIVSVNGSKIDNGSITMVKLGDSVTSAYIAADSITGAKVQDGSLTSADFQSGGLAKVYVVRGTFNACFYTQSSWTDMSRMTWTMPATAGAVYVFNFSIGVHQSSNNEAFSIRLLLNGSEVARTLQMIEGGQYDSISFSHAQWLGAGTHVVKIQYYKYWNSYGTCDDQVYGLRKLVIQEIPMASFQDVTNGTP